jgi:hypothetical protein
MIRIMYGSRGEYSIYNIIVILGNDTSRVSLILKVETVSTPVVAVVVVVVGLCRGRGSSCSRRFYSAVVVVGVSRELSCSEPVLWTTNCPLVLACCGLEAVVTFSGHFHTVVTLHFRIQSVFLLF